MPSRIVIFLLLNTGAHFRFLYFIADSTCPNKFLTIPRARSLYSKIVYCVTHWYSRTYTRAITPPRFT